MSRRLWLELLALSSLLIGVVLVVLTAGQLVKVGDLLWAAGPSLWGRALGLAAVVLLEAALPLTPLLAAGLVYGRLRAEGAWVAQAALGVSPLRQWGPAVGLGGLLGLAAAGLAAGPGPRAVERLGETLMGAAAAGLTRPGPAIRLPGGGLLRVGRGEVWGVLPRRGGPPVILRAGSVRATVRPAGEATLDLGQVWLWDPRLRVRAGRARVRLTARGLRRRLGMLGPPNSLPSGALGPSAHHRFTWHRRLALPAMAPLWGLLGALLGGRVGGAAAVLCGAGGMALAYWLLRVGELNARAGFAPPWFAAWAPAMVLALVTVAWARRRSALL